MENWSIARDPETNLSCCVIKELELAERKVLIRVCFKEGKFSLPSEFDTFQYIDDPLYFTSMADKIAADQLRLEVNRRAEKKEKLIPPLERAQKILTGEKWSWSKEDQILKVLGCIVEHLQLNFSIDKHE
jgi:hypothetical protein